MMAFKAYCSDLCLHIAILLYILLHIDVLYVVMNIETKNVGYTLFTNA